MKIEKPVVEKPFGSHCHERVFMAMEALESASKQAIADCAGTTVAVVANAIHDFKRGMYTRSGARTAVEKVRVGKEWFYELGESDQLELF